MTANDNQSAKAVKAKAVKEEIIKIGNVELIVCVLDNGQRVIEEKSFNKFFEAMTNGTLGEFTDKDAMKLARACKLGDFGESEDLAGEKK